MEPDYGPCMSCTNTTKEKYRREDSFWLFLCSRCSNLHMTKGGKTMAERLTEEEVEALKEVIKENTTLLDSSNRPGGISYVHDIKRLKFWKDLLEKVLRMEADKSKH